MPKGLTQEQLEAYERDGFCSPVDVMTEAEAEGLRVRLEAVEKEHPEVLAPSERNNAHLVLSAIDEIAHHPGILDAVEDVLGPDILVFGSVLFAKEPHSPGFVSWHQDATYMGLSPHVGVTAWVALSPSTPESGCMRMLPGTHKDGIRDHVDTFGDDNILTRGQEIDIGDTDDESRAVDLVLRPGQMSLHHCRTIHSSRPNKADYRRIGVVIQSYIPHHVHQTIGDSAVQWARGADVPDHHEQLPRPAGDLDPDDVARRARVNADWAEVLYHNARQKRAL